jgi:DNA-binding LytR/AlgR family response regulator
MGESSGLELARALQKRPLAPALLFVAQDQGQAFEAFEIGAVDYFTWPASQDRLEQSLDRLRRYSKGPQTTRTTQDSRPNRSSGSGQDRTLRLELKDDEEEDLVKALEQAWSEQPQPKAPDKLPVRESGRTLLVPFERIIFIEAEDDYAFVHTASSKYLTSYRLKHLEGRLAEHRFFRIHRKYLVNLDMVTEVASMPGSNLMLRTAGSTRIELPVSRRRINDLKALLGL